MYEGPEVGVVVGALCLPELAALLHLFKLDPVDDRVAAQLRLVVHVVLNL